MNEFVYYISVCVHVCVYLKAVRAEWAAWRPAQQHSVTMETNEASTEKMIIMEREWRWSLIYLRSVYLLSHINMNNLSNFRLLVLHIAIIALDLSN